MYHGVTIDFAIVGAGPPVRSRRSASRAPGAGHDLRPRAPSREALRRRGHPRAPSRFSMTPAGPREATPAVQIRTARFTDSSAALRPLCRSPSIRRLSRRREPRGVRWGAAPRGRGGWRDAAPSRVADVVRTGRRFHVRTADGQSWRAAALVGADGPNSLVDAACCAPFRRDQLSIATGFFAARRHQRRDRHRDHDRSSWLHLVVSSPRSPGDRHLRTGRPRLPRRRSGPTAAGVDRRDRHRARRARSDAYSWPIPSLSASDFDASSTRGPGFVLVGDAAGLVDPITREGIVYALHSATIAADALASCRPAGRRPTRERVRDELAAGVARAARFKAGFFKPRFSGLLLRRARERASRSGGSWPTSVAGEQSYRGLKWRLARTWSSA